MSKPEKCNQLQIRRSADGESLNCEVRFTADAEDGTIEGRAVTFNVVDSYHTSFDPHAFEWRGERLPMLWSHRPDEVVGSVRSIEARSDGLHIVGKLNLDVQRAREVRSMLQAGDISGLSIGFNRLKDEARANGVRHITKANLREVSFVASPSVPGSRVTSIRANSGSLAGFTEAVLALSTSLRRKG